MSDFDDEFEKKPSESYPIEFDFSANMVDGETHLNYTATAIDIQTGIIADVLSDTSDTGMSIFSRVHGGVKGQKYSLSIKTETSSDNKWEMKLKMEIS